MKRCPKCKILKNLSDFSRSKNRKDGFAGHCKLCVIDYKNNREISVDRKEKSRRYQLEYSRSARRKETLKLYGESDKGKLTKYKSKLKRKYGLTISGLKDLLDKQQNKCAVCYTEFKDSKNRHIDHCHSTLKIRGILCNHCNRALGASFDNITILSSLIKYLNKNESGDN